MLPSSRIKGLDIKALPRFNIRIVTLDMSILIKLKRKNVKVDLMEFVTDEVFDKQHFDMYAKINPTCFHFQYG